MSHDALKSLEQNTTRWLNWRAKGIGASDAPTIMGVSSWSTPYQLWLEKTGQVVREFKTNWAIERGNRWEPAARARYELEYDLDMPAEIMVHPKYRFLRASLDGWNEATRIVLEIKIPGAEVFDAAKQNICHEKYYPQVQHQILVTGAVEAHFYCAKVEKTEGGVEKIVDTALVRVPPDEKYQAKLLEKELEFWECVQKRRPPRLAKGDCLMLLDDESVELFKEFRQAKKTLDEAKAYYDEMRIRVEEKMIHSKVECQGVTVTKNKKGTLLVKIKD